MRGGFEMANRPNKTIETDGDIPAYVARIEPAEKRAAARVLINLFSRITGHPPKLWGPSIIGFGTYQYKYESGREGESPRAGFAPRKANIVLYLTSGYENAVTRETMDELRSKLGKHKIGKSCLYINKLSDVDLSVLEQIIQIDTAYMNARYSQ
jgi:nucleoid DNA-binding protein